MTSGKGECSVTGKRRFGRSIDAVIANAHNRQFVRPYRCRYCGGWHVTRQPKRGRR